MLGLIFIYFVGKAFYDLAHKHGRNEWGYAILGVVSYYGGIFLGAFLIGILFEVFSPDSLEDYSDTVLGLMALPIGILTCWLTYRMFRINWSAKPASFDDDKIIDKDL